MQRYFAKSKENNYIILEDSDIFHVFKVMRNKNKDKIECVFKDTLYICEIEEDKFKILKSMEHRQTKIKIEIVIPILKEQKMDLILQKTTELGVDEITIVNTERTVVKIEEKTEKKLIRWKTICKEAAEQSKRITIPNIRGIINLRDFVVDENALSIVTNPYEKENSIKSILQNVNSYDKITLVVGPEGGLSDKEIEDLVRKGFISISLGKRVLRTETAPIYLMSILSFLELE
jgi:16S rRNA (uracil1498-N3)-methyltransferase